MKAVGNALKISIFILLSMIAAVSPLFAQQPSQCLTKEEVNRAIDLIKNPPPTISENKALRRELLNMREAYQKLEQKISENWAENQKLIPTLNQTSESNFLRLCEIIKQYGWVREEMATEEGATAAVFIIRGNNIAHLQKEIFPVAVAATEKGYLGKNQLAWLIDSIRTSTGAPQIFGTQTRVRNELFYLLPLQNEEKVDVWRKMYNLPPLDSYIRYLQGEFQTVVIKSPRAATPPQLREKKQAPSAEDTTADVPETMAGELLNLEREETIKVESSLVNLNVRIFARDAAATAASAAAAASFNLRKDDFVVLENGKPQQIEFFSAAEAPFDLVLLLDLSGSTAKKKDLIRQSTQRFVEAARPTDRIAIVTFTDRVKIISDLTENRQLLLASVAEIKDDGSSGVQLDVVSSFSDSSPLLHLLAPGRWINSSIPDNNYQEYAGTSSSGARAM